MEDVTSFPVVTSLTLSQGARVRTDATGTGPTKERDPRYPVKFRGRDSDPGPSTTG